MSKKTTRKSPEQKRGRQSKPLPSQPKSWNIGARCSDANNAASVTLNGFEVFQCVFKPEDFIEAYVRQSPEVLPPSQEEIDIAIKSLQERDGIENPSHAGNRSDVLSA